MSLTDQDVRRIAHLARIHMTDEELPLYRGQLDSILHLIEKMQAVDTSGVEPMTQAREVHLHPRPDVVTETDRHEVFQAQAPQVEAGLYLVPKVIE